MTHAFHSAATLLADGGEPVVVLIFVLFVGVVITLGIFSARAARQRREALTVLASDIGFAFDSSTVDRPPPGATAFNVFTQGEDRRSSNTLIGTRVFATSRTVAVAMGDYQYVTESGSGKDRSRTTHYLSYALFRLPFAVAERLAVRREGLFDKIASAIGFEDIDFESVEFSKRYHISSSDRKVAYDLFDPRMIDWCMDNEIPRIEVRGELCLVCDERTWKPEQFAAQLAWMNAFLDRWPEHLLQRLEGPPVGATPP